MQRVKYPMVSWTFSGGRAVHRIGLGAMRLTGQPGNWGPYPDKERARRVFQRVLDLGGNFIDTAISYGAGHSEMLIAELLHPYPTGLMIATKGGNIKTGPGELKRDGTPENLRRSCEASLGYLKTDCINLYQLHAVDRNVPIEDSIDALATLKQEGKIARIGLCNVRVDQIEIARRITEVESVQNRYNLSDRRNQKVVDYCRDQGIVFVPHGGARSGETKVPNDRDMLHVGFHRKSCVNPRAR